MTAAGVDSKGAVSMAADMIGAFAAETSMGKASKAEGLVAAASMAAVVFMAEAALTVVAAFTAEAALTVAGTGKVGF